MQVCASEFDTMRGKAQNKSSQEIRSQEMLRDLSETLLFRGTFINRSNLKNLESRLAFTQRVWKPNTSLKLVAYLLGVQEYLQLQIIK